MISRFYWIAFFVLAVGSFWTGGCESSQVGGYVPVPLAGEDVDGDTSGPEDPEDTEATNGG